jgi:hypothetical protein
LPLYETSKTKDTTQKTKNDEQHKPDQNLEENPKTGGEPKHWRRTHTLEENPKTGGEPK